MFTMFTGKLSLKSFIVAIKQIICLITTTAKVINIITRNMYFKGINAPANVRLHFLNIKQRMKVNMFAIVKTNFLPEEYENMSTMLNSNLNIYIVSKCFNSFLFIVI